MLVAKEASKALFLSYKSEKKLQKFVGLIGRECSMWSWWC
jgi:hypothetical protein